MWVSIILSSLYHSPIDASTLPVNHGSQPIAFGALSRKARGTSRKARRTGRDGEMALQAELGSRATTQRKQCWHIVTDGRKKKKRGTRHCCFDQCRSDERCLKKCKGIAFFLFHKPKRGLEDCKAWIRACGRPHDQGPVSWRPTTVK